MLFSIIFPTLHMISKHKQHKSAPLKTMTESRPFFMDREFKYSADAIISAIDTDNKKIQCQTIFVMRTKINIPEFYVEIKKTGLLEEMCEDNLAVVNEKN
jgi:hypothetical protein